MTEMFGEAWPPMSVPDLAPDDDDDDSQSLIFQLSQFRVTVATLRLFDHDRLRVAQIYRLPVLL